MIDPRPHLLDQIYARAPAVACKGLCTEACGPISASELEVRRLEHVTTRPLRVDGRLTCSMLTAGRCVGYAARPLICRLYGAVKRLRCEFGCVPGRWLSDADAYALLAAVEDLGGPPRTSALPSPERCR